MRLPLILPAELTADQRPLYENMREGIQKNFKGFETIAENGALMGPWNPWIHEPKFGKPIWELTLGLAAWPLRRQAHHHRRRPATKRPHARGGDRIRRHVRPRQLRHAAGA